MLRAAASAAAAAAAATTALRAPAFAAAWLARRYASSDDPPPTPDTPSTSGGGGDASPPTRTRTRRAPRRVRGSWADSEELTAELEGAPVPPGANIYDLQATFPYFYAPQGGDVVRDAVRGGAGGAHDPPPPRPGARRVVRWETTAVLHAGPASARHPSAAKVAASVHLADLAAEAGLSPDAAKHVALVAGPRYNPRTGVLRLTEDRHAEREDNAAALRATLSELVKEGRRRFPG